MIRNAVALLVVLAFAGSLHADEIIYYVKKGTKREIASHGNVTVTAWSANKVDFRGADGKTGSVSALDVISVNRNYGTMSNDLQRAIEKVGSDPDAAKADLQRLTGTGNELDKEEALYWLALVNVNDANAGGNVQPALTALGNYLRAKKGGFFAREAYRLTADLQRRTKKIADARTTLGAMISADPALAREGNQLLGELEYGEKRYAEAIRAFQNAKAQATRDGNKNFEYLAVAWEGTALVANNNAAGARQLLEPIVSDEAFDDPIGFDDEIALAVAYPALGDAYYATSQFEKAYDAYVKAGYYVWWVQGANEGYCIGQAYLCARKLEGKGDVWKKRRDKLRNVLALGFPRELQRVDKEK
ncbi:MAG: hypothetical protein KF696_02335 [Planctomycetes bacterium]|nr:hypothetical protein [Planctomycetota bacterium]MCW8134840.1 hypothetical protein [Planctomycetota bacterium]